jgi:hypothetical protein
VQIQLLSVPRLEIVLVSAAMTLAGYITNHLDIRFSGRAQWVTVEVILIAVAIAVLVTLPALRPVSERLSSRRGMRTRWTALAGSP